MFVSNHLNSIRVNLLKLNEISDALKENKQISKHNFTAQYESVLRSYLSTLTNEYNNIWSCLPKLETAKHSELEEDEEDEDNYEWDEWKENEENADDNQ